MVLDLGVGLVARNGGVKAHHVTEHQRMDLMDDKYFVTRIYVQFHLSKDLQQNSNVIIHILVDVPQKER